MGHCEISNIQIIMKNFIILTALLLSFTEVCAQFYFKPDTVHEWEVDTFINAKGRSEMFMYSGTCNTYYNDSVQSRVSVYTDSLGQVLYFGTSFREVGASFFFNKGNNILTSAKVGVYQDKESSLSISTEFPMDEY